MTKAKITFCNEEKLLQEEKERRRKLRLIQVREVSKQNAAQIREAFRKEKEKEIKKLLTEQIEIKAKEHEENFNQVKKIVQKEIDIIGQGHISAANYDDKKEARLKQAIEDEEKALIRGRTALLVQREEKILIENKENAHINAREKALEQERIRASKIAKLPKPVDELEKIINKKPTKVVSVHDADAFMTTRYHMPETTIDKPSIDEIDNFDARKNAIEEEIRQKSLEKENQRQINERLEKARLRGKHALEKEILNENYNQILNELDQLQQADREKRQKELQKIPKEIFLPSWQRDQDRNEFQLELEREFEKIYVDANMRKEEMPKPVDMKKLDVSQTNSQDSELDLTLINDEQIVQIENEAIKSNLINDNEENNIQSNIPLNEPKIIENTNQNNCNINKTQTENSVLNKLLDKIRKQREEIAIKSSQINNNISLDDSAASDLTVNEKPTQEISNKIMENFENSKNKNITSDSDKIEIGLIESLIEDTNQSDVLSNEEELSYTLSLNSTDSKSFNETNKKSLELNMKEKKIIKGIMMSSHNVSSINELIDSNGMLLNAKIISKNQRREVSNNQNTVNENNNLIRNTATYSLDLSHASRDPMVAGPKELFNKNDAKLAIELKQKLIQKQQDELLEQLKKLEEQEKQILMHENNKQQSQQKQEKQGENFLNESINNSSLTQSHSLETLSKSNRQSNENKSFNEDDLKRLEYQKYLLTLATEKKLNEDDSYKQNTQLLEDRKKEINKKFGIEIHSSSCSSLNTNEPASLISKKPPLAQNNYSSNNHHLQQQHDDKHTIYSGDSGFVSSSNQFNLNLRNQNNLNQMNKKPINLAVEQLNKEIINVSKPSNLLNKQQITQQTELLNYLNGGINEEDYKRRLSSISTSSSISSTFLSNDHVSKLFGLEFYDSNNMTDIRDLSIEQIIGFVQQQQLQQNQKILQQNSNDPKSKSSGLFTKTSSVSSNDTLNDQSSEDSFHDISFGKNKQKQISNELSTDQDDEDDDEDEDSQKLIMSLLNKNKNLKNSNQNSLNAIDLKRQFIQDQLEMVRRQKDQLEIQQKQQQNKAFNHGLVQSSSLPPPVKMNKFVNDINLHELSTIKEVDTPASERNLKLINNTNITNRQSQLITNQNNRSSINLTTVSSMDLSTTSLEDVTTLSDTNLQMTANCEKKLNEHRRKSPSNSLFHTTLIEERDEKNNQDKSASSTSSSFTSTSTPINSSLNHQLIQNKNIHNTNSNEATRLLNLEILRKKQMQLLNISLFDSSNSISNQNSSLASPVNINNNQNETKNSKKIEYGELIFDSLLTNNLTITQQTFGQTTYNQSNLISPNTTQVPTQKPVAFKTESTNSIFTNQSKNLNLNNNNNNNNLSFNSNHKKWFDILASSTDDEKSLKEKSVLIDNASTNSMISILSQGKLNDSTLDEEKIIDQSINNNNDNNNLSITSSNSSFLNSLVQGPLNRSSLQSVSASVLIDTSFGSLKSSRSNKNESFKELKLFNKIQENNEVTNSFQMTSLPAETTNNYKYSSSGVATESNESNSVITNNNQTNNKTGLFDRFLKSYSSSAATQSVLDEPEISFVSYKTNSNPASPKSKINQTNSTNYTLSSNEKTELSSNNSNFSLIQIQQKQLSKQFNNISPIDACAFNTSASQVDNSKFFKSFSTTIPFETSSSVSKDTKYTKSIIEGSLKEDDEEQDQKSNQSLSSDDLSLIEGRLTVPYDLTSVSNFNNFIKSEKMIKNKTTNSSYNNNKTMNSLGKQTNQFTNVSSLDTSSRKSDSLISFEHHELSQMTPLQKKKGNSSKSENSLTTKPINHFETYEDDNENQYSECESTIISLKQFSINKSNDTNQQSPICNSTPMVSLNPTTNSYNQSFDNEFDDTDNSLYYLNGSNKKRKERKDIKLDDLNIFYCEAKKASCSYCKSFYTVQGLRDIIVKKELKNKEKKKDLNRDLARNVTQEFYFVDFDGHKFELDYLKELNNKNDFKYDLQKSCLKHLAKIRNNKINVKNKSKFNRFIKTKKLNQTNGIRIDRETKLKNKYPIETKLKNLQMFRRTKPKFSKSNIFETIQLDLDFL